MNTNDLTSFAVSELSKSMLVKINGGDIVPMVCDPSVWWSVATQIINAAYIILKSAGEAYVRYSAETGGKFVFHHVQEP